MNDAPEDNPIGQITFMRLGLSALPDKQKASPFRERLRWIAISKVLKRTHYASAFLQQAFAQSAPHFLASAFLSLEQEEHSAFLAASFLAAQPHVSHANAADPATKNATTAILIIFFMAVLLLSS
jgi:hypothetical protein